MLERMAGMEQHDNTQCTTTTTTITSTTTTTTGTTTTSTTIVEVGTCSTPGAAGGTWVVVPQTDSTMVWVLSCDEGYKSNVESAAYTAGGYLSCIGDGVFSPDAAVADDRADECQATTQKCRGFDSSRYHGDTVIGGTCPADGIMLAGETCKATCSNNVTATGTILCDGGVVTVGFSYCIDPAGTNVAAEAQMLSGGIEANFGSAPAKEDITTAFCSAFLGGQNCGFVYSIDIGFPSSRRLGNQRFLLDVDEISGSDRADPRRLGVVYSLNYTIAVPTSETSIDFAAIIVKARSFASSNSTALTAFTDSLQSNGVTVTGITQTIVPTASVGFVLKDAEGNLVAVGTPSAATVATATAEDGSSGMLAIMAGGAIGGCFGMALLGGCAYYFVVMKKKAEC